MEPLTQLAAFFECGKEGAEREHAVIVPGAGRDR